ncbi:hypothetical protein DFH09DRAFT_1093884 [Mycena vulgaris]|nr:hypothetical protein DFH09DRAFT_1093884 [Mycena vulgaris]
MPWKHCSTGLTLSCFDVLYAKKLSHPRSELDKIATTILAHLFYVLELSIKFLRKSRWRHDLRALIGFPDDLMQALQNLNGLEKEMRSMMGAYSLVAADGLLAAGSAAEEFIPPVQRTQTKISVETNIEHTRQDLQALHLVQVHHDIKEWLLATDPTTDRNAALAKRQEGTGNWFLQTEAFKKWRSSGGNPVLWLHAQYKGAIWNLYNTLHQQMWELSLCPDVLGKHVASLMAFTNQRKGLEKLYIVKDKHLRHRESHGKLLAR